MKDIIENTRGREIPPRPEVPITERTGMRIFSQINHQVKDLYNKESYKTSDFDKLSIEKWNSNEENGIGIMYQLLQNPDPPKVD